MSHTETRAAAQASARPIGRADIQHLRKQLFALEKVVNDLEIGRTRDLNIFVHRMWAAIGDLDETVETFEALTA
jgi:hypothetical protein